MDQGYVQVYTGNGKGKTTAALGLTMRAAGAGLRVYIGQFIKSMEYHEIRILRDRFPEVMVELYGLDGCILTPEPSERDKKAALQGYRRAAEIISGGEYDIVILDEITIAYYFHLLTREQIMTLLDGRPAGTELVLTGRYAPDWLLDAADLVSTVEETRHYYSAGVEARDGIER